MAISCMDIARLLVAAAKVHEAHESSKEYANHLLDVAEPALMLVVANSNIL